MMEEVNLAGAVLAEGSVLKEKYTVEGLIGTGGFGRTYRMRDNLLNIPVAVKELTNAAEKGVGQFLEEARVMARFSQNQGIVNVRDFFEANGTAYIVMEYLDGMDLCEYVKSRGTMTMDETFEKLRPILEALAVIHEEGFIHRDISPDNIRVTADGKMKLLDFGAARDVSEDGRTMTVLLKKGYTPEEQYRGKEYQGPWTDVYALCGVFYYCLTGKTPVDCIQRLFHDDLKAPSQMGARINDRQEAALLKGLALRADDRFSSMKELQKALSTGGEEDEEKEAAKEKEGIKEKEGTKGKEGAEENVSPEDIWARIEGQKREAPREERKKSIEGQAEDRRQKENRRKEPEEKEKSVQAKTRQTPEPKKKKKGKMLLWLSLGGGVIGVAAIVLLFSLLWSVNPYRESDIKSYSQISEKTVTVKDIQKIGKDKECKTLTLIRCQVSDSVVEAIAQLENVKALRLYYCNGFTNLNPLAGMTQMTELNIWGDNSASEVLDGDALFGQDFPQVTYLVLSGYERLTGTDFLKHFPALESFYLPIEGCESLEFFNYMDNMERITIDTDLTGVDLSPIGHCRHLDSLTLAGTGIDDLSMVEGMEELTSIDVTDCRVSDISSLRDCSNLVSLYMDGNQISDLSALEGKEELITLSLNRNQVEDINPLAGLGLWNLELAENQIQDISPLRSCEELQSLFLQKNQIQDVSCLAGCRNMKSLNLAGNQLENLSGCEAMIALTSFYANDNRLTDIEGIANSTSIKYMDLGNNQIGDIDALATGFTSLRGLKISDNQVKDIKVLEKCGELRYLMADRNQIVSLAPLKNASSLNVIFVDENNLVNLEGLENKDNLFAITAYGNQLEDIQVLSTCPNLLYLDLGRNQIRDVAPLKGLSFKSKGMVLLEHNQIEDVSSFPVNSAYYLLTLYDNPMTDLSLIAKIEDVNSFNDSFYLPYGADTDYKALGELNLGQSICLVDAPLSEQAAILKQTEESNLNRTRGGIRFATGDEADKEMEDYRRELKEECRQELQLIEGDAAIAAIAQ